MIVVIETETNPSNIIRAFYSKDICSRDGVFVTNSKVKLEKYGIVTKVDNYSVFSKKVFFKFDATKHWAWRALENIVRIEH